VNNEIMNSINEFWADIDIEKDKLIIAADQMVLLYLYITI